MSNTNAVEVIIHDTSPLLQSKPLSPHLGVAGAAAGAAAAGAAAAGAAAAGAAASAGFSAGLSCANNGRACAPSIATSASDANNFLVNRFIAASLERFRAGLAGADADDLLQIEDEDLSIAYLSGVGRLLDRLDRLIEHFVLDGGLDFHFRQEIDHVLRAAIQLGVTFLPAEALDLGDGDALNADGGQGFPHLVKLEGLDDCGDQFHEMCSLVG